MATDRITIKEVVFEGKILNDDRTDIDSLDHVVFAKTLVNQIEQIKTPVTIGIFSEWGSGKTCLLDHVQCLLKFMTEQKKIENKKRVKTDSESQMSKKGNKFCNKRWLLPTFSLLAVFGIIAIAMVLIQINGLGNTFIYVLVGILLVLVLAVYVIILVSAKECEEECDSYWLTVLYGLFTILPIKSHYKNTAVSVAMQDKCVLQKHDTGSRDSCANHSNETHKACCDKKDEDAQKTQKYIFVNFNAWEYAGCDILWAGIITNLADAIENEFGSLSSRLFRYISLETKTKFQHQATFIVNTSKDGKQVKEDMAQYGKVINVVEDKDESNTMTETKDQTTSRNNKAWKVTFEKLCEAKCAFNVLRQEQRDCYSDLKWIKEPKDGRQSTGISRFWDYYMKQPRVTCGLPNLALLGIAVIVAAAFPIVLHVVLTITGQSTSPIKIFSEVVSLVPAIFGAMYTSVSFVIAYAYSQSSRIVNAINTKQKNISEQLGFMNTIKKEVKAITDFIHAIEFAYNVRYKVIITIDDLDRVPHPKVRCVLESINILLSERNSPFVCLIAVDSRIATKCFEEIIDGEYVSNISGHEYLKKIVNLPFYLPKVNDMNRSKYIAGLIDQADHTHDIFKNEDEKAKDYADCVPSDSVPKGHAIEVKLPNDTIDLKNFLLACRKFMYDETYVQRHLIGNPRNIKRIFNVISMTSSVIRNHQEIRIQKKEVKEVKDFTNIPSTSQRSHESPHNRENEHLSLAEQIVLWVILTVQWPFRISYIIEVIEDADQRLDTGLVEENIPNNWSLLKIYNEKVREKIADWKVNDLHFAMDGDADIMYSFLKHLEQKNKLSKGDVVKLLHYTVNLDHSLRRDISIQRNKEFDKRNPSKASHSTNERFAQPTDYHDEPDTSRTEKSAASHASKTEERCLSNNSTEKEPFLSMNDTQTFDRTSHPEAENQIENTAAGELLLMMGQQQ